MISQSSDLWSRGLRRLAGTSGQPPAGRGAPPGRVPAILDWVVDSGPDQQAIARAPAPPPRRWGLTLAAGLIALVVILALFTAVMRTPPPPALATVIDQEARALALGDQQAFITLQDPDDHPWQALQLQDLAGWQTTTVTAQLYRVFQTGALADNRAWADVNQFRNGQYFRQVRFYRLDGDHWVRIAPGAALASVPEQTAPAPHFDLAFHAMDAQLAKVLADRFEADYQLICVDLGCPADASGVLTRDTSLTLMFDPGVVTPVFSYADGKFSLPSPGLTGLAFRDLGATQLSDTQAVDAIAFQALPGVIARIASGGAGRWASSMQGDLLAGNIGQWEQLRLAPTTAAFDPAALKRRLRASPTSLNLETIWNAQPPYTLAGLSALVDQTWGFILFVDQNYGPAGMRRLLAAIGPAQALAEAVQNGLGLNQADLAQQWQNWLRQDL